MTRVKIIAAAQGGFSPQLIRAAAILRMSALSLAQFLSQHNNPCLRVGGLPKMAQEEADEADDLRERLRAECRETPLPPEMRPLVMWLVEGVDDDGFLELPDELPLPREEMEAGVRQLQALAPAGVGARSAQERVLLLLAQEPASAARQCAEGLVAKHWEWLQRKRWDKLPQRGLMAALQLLEGLPATATGGAAAAASVPDVLFARQRGLWRAQPAAGVDISAAARRTADATLSEWREAREVASAVAMRRKWVLAAAQYAADRQSAFFTQGVAALLPLPMKDAAADLKISAGMLSHIVGGKRAIFANGEIPLKYLYGSNTGSAVIRHKIQAMIGTENPRRPLSDEALCGALRLQGVHIARRTIAKHRQQAGIAAAAMRKRATPN